MASVILLGLCFILLCFILYKFAYDRPKNFPPGPPSLPFCGAYLYMLLVNYKWPNRAAQYFSKIYKSDIVGFCLGPFPFVVANGYKACKEILNRTEFDGRPDVFMGRLRDPNFNKKGIFFNDGPIWKEQRRFILRYLRDFGFGRRFTELEAVINEEVKDLIEILKTGPKYEHEAEFFQKGKAFCPNFFTYANTNCLLYIICNERFPRSERAILNKLVNAGMQFQRNGDDYGLFLSMRPIIHYFFPKFSKYNVLRDSTTVMYNFFKEQVEKNLDTYDESHDRHFIDMYIREVNEAKKNGNTDTTFKYDQFYLSLVDFAFPAITAIGSQISLLIQRMLIKPEVLHKIQAEIDEIVGHGRLPILDDRKNMPYTEAAIREGLRIDTLVPSSVPHRALVDTELMGYKIPKDTIVVPALESFHNDPELWTDPQNFRPERFLDDNGKLCLNKDISLPFGAGKRLCAGETFARNMLFILTTAICQNFDLALAPGEKIPDMSKTLSGVIISPPDFWIHLKIINIIKKLSVFVVLLLCFNVNNSLQDCADVKPIATFTPELFTGAWFLYSKNKEDSLPEDAKSCHMANIIGLDDGNYAFIVNNIVNTAEEQTEEMFYGKAVAVEKGLGKFNTEFKSLKKFEDHEFSILATDYTEFAVFHSCMDGEDMYTIYTREDDEFENEDFLTVANEILEQNGLDPEKLIKVDESLCYD